MEVVAVSRSLPVEYNVNGLKIKTSIVHTPLVAPDQYIELDENGVKDNATAAHDGPVYVALAENYDYWCSELDIDRSSWDWCHWGENITFRCTSKKMTEVDFHLGDVWKVGNDVLLEVCGSRIPCAKLSWRCGQKDSWLKPLADTGRVGIYLRVIQGGRIYPGDDAVLKSSSGDSMNVAIISKLAFETDLKTRDTVNLLTNHPVLLRLNRFMLERRLTNMDDKITVGKNAWKGRRDFRPRRIVDESDNVKSFYLEPVDGKPLAYYLPGQFLTVRLPNGLLRNWTISDWTGRDAPKYYRISVKAATEASVWMHKECTTDTVLSVRAPAGRFRLDWTQIVNFRQVYISAGIGITPVLAMMKAHASHPSMQRSPGVWVHVTRDGKHSIFQEEFDAIENNPIQRVVFFSQPRSSDILGKDFDRQGRPDREVLAGLLAGDYTMNPLGVTDMTLPAKLSRVYICGPTDFETTMKEHLQSFGIPPTFINSETFSVSGAPTGGVDKALVRFTKSGKSAVWEKDKPKSLLELAESLGLTPDYGCRVGACGSCATKVVCGSVAGGMQMDGSVLTCSATPSSEEVELEL